MKRIFLIIALAISLMACNDSVAPSPNKNKDTTVKGRVVLINSKIPVSGINVYLWSLTDGLFLEKTLVDEGLSDSSGFFEFNFSGNKGVNADLFYNSPYLGHRIKEAHKGEFSNDGIIKNLTFELIPPSWININLKNVDDSFTWDGILINGGYSHGPEIRSLHQKDSVFTLKVCGNMMDTITLQYGLDKTGVLDYKIIKTIKYPVNVPAFQTQDLLIEY